MSFFCTPFHTHITAGLRRVKSSLDFAQRRLAFSCVALGLVGALVGCGGGEPERAEAPQPPASHNGASAPAAWEKGLNTWVRGLSKPQSNAKAQPAPTPATPPVHLNVGAIAQRHPAWKLAKALEENRVSAMDFAAIQAAGVSLPELARPSFDVHFENTLPQPAREGGKAAPGAGEAGEYRRDTQTVTAAGLEALQNETADRQTDALDNFLRAVDAHQSDRLEEYTSIRHSLLESELDVLRNAPLPEMDPPLLSADDQLRVTNLRLKLLRSIAKTDEERDQARAELNEILSHWQERIRAREKERQAELQRIRVEIPRQAAIEGEARLQQEIEALRRQDRLARQALMREHRERVLQDFGGDAARLGITLPAAFAPVPESPPPLAGGPEEIFAGNGMDLIETNRPMPASARALGRVTPVRVAGASGFSLPAGDRNALAQALKAQAWHDARVQATMAARRFGWNWQAGVKAPTGATDRTGEALQWLFG